MTEPTLRDALEALERYAKRSRAHPVTYRAGILDAIATLRAAAETPAPYPCINCLTTLDLCSPVGVCCADCDHPYARPVPAADADRERLADFIRRAEACDSMPSLAAYQTLVADLIEWKR